MYIVFPLHDINIHGQAKVNDFVSLVAIKKSAIGNSSANELLKRKKYHSIRKISIIGKKCAIEGGGIKGKPYTCMHTCIISMHRNK